MVDSKKGGKLRRKLDNGEITPQQALVMALNHPMRVRILTILTERPASPKQLEDLGIDSLTMVAYHCRQLWELRQIEVVEELQKRGAVEHIYRAVNAPIFSNPDWEKFDPIVRRAISAYGVDEIFRDVNAALGAGSFDASTQRHLSRAPSMMLDERAFLEAAAVQNEALERILGIQEEAEERMEEADEKAKAEFFPVTAAMACFMMPVPESDPAE